ncbi:MAG: hypothetical protein E7162_04610 [Firmicutes bacterium]|nr:hypothetical protein [Bacillota bacterium]
MKGAKGGNRDRIISWLFSERTRKKREEELELEKIEENKIDEKRKERRKSKKNDTDTNLEHVEELEVSQKDEEVLSTIPFVEQPEDKTKEKTKDRKDNQQPLTSEDDLDLTLIDIFDTSRDKKPKDKNKEKPDTIIEVSEIISEIDDKKKEEKHEEVNTPTKIEVHELEKPELIKISIIEELEELLRNDSYDLKDIQYRIEVLQQQEKDEVLLENIEKIQKELEDLIKRFNYIKDKYADLYGYISIKDMEFITGLGIGNAIRDYIGNGKDGFDNSKTIDQINEIKEFIEIINGIIDVEKKKEDLSLKVDQKLEDFGIRDEEFIKLQDRYTNVEAINSKVDEYNRTITSSLKDIEAKIADSVDISRRIETTTSIVPDLNRIMEATVLMASTSLIPPTPLGQLFKASLFISATHMMATALTPRTEQKEVITTTVTDYSRDIQISKDNINSILNNIDNAFNEISYMKDTFQKEFSQYASQIPEYDKLIQNMFNIEKELERQQYIAYDYSISFDQALNKNNQKVKRMENE